MAICRRPVPEEKNESEKTAAAPAGALTCARRRLCVALLVLLGFSLVALTLWFARHEGIRG